MVFITSDGISDNFDPVVGKFCVVKKEGDIEENCDLNKPVTMCVLHLYPSTFFYNFIFTLIFVLVNFAKYPIFCDCFGPSFQGIFFRKSF